MTKDISLYNLTKNPHKCITYVYSPVEYLYLYYTLPNYKYVFYQNFGRISRFCVFCFIRKRNTDLYKRVIIDLFKIKIDALSNVLMDLTHTKTLTTLW